jgi:hypothetical protein
MHTTRPAAVAGMFYPDSPAELRRTVGQMLADAGHAEARHVPKALIVPHAGYIYSGPVAATAYARLSALRGRIRRVVLLGPTHRVYVRGLALPDAERFATPLGDVALDVDAMAKLVGLPQVVKSDAAHQMEHSLEVQLPFLQQVLGDFDLLPLAVGEASAEQVAEVLEKVWGGPETLIVISSDLSHYLPSELAREVDNGTVHAIMALDSHLNHEQACGATPINGLMLAARRHHLRPVTLDVRNSGDTAGDPSRVVGYASFAFEPEDDTDQPDPNKGETLITLARSEIAARLGQDAPSPGDAAWLREHGATFVTLTKDGVLRGCVGTLAAHRPLGEDVRGNAIAAAFHDPRFAPLAPGELEDVGVEVSLLSPAEALAVGSEAEALALLRPNVDGVVFEYRHFRSTFLPQVWEQLPNPPEFLGYLKRKAGLPMNFWDDGVRLSRYTVTKWKEAAA